MDRKFCVKAKIIYIFSSFYCLALVYVKLYFWILQGLYRLLFRVRQWRKSAFTVLYIVPSLMFCTEFNKCDLKITGTMLKTQAHFRGYSSMKATVNLLCCSHARCVSPLCLQRKPQREAGLLVLVCSLQSRLVLVGELLLATRTFNWLAKFSQSSIWCPVLNFLFLRSWVCCTSMCYCPTSAFWVSQL